MLRFLLAFLFFTLGAAAPAWAQTSLAGWWRADLMHAGERQPFYLHLTEQDGQPLARITVPAIRAHDAAIGAYRLEGGALHLPDLSWVLSLREDGAELHGVMPPSLAPSYRIPVRFVRSDPAPALPPIAARHSPPQPRWSVSIGAPVWAGLLHDSRRRQVVVGADDGSVRALAAQSGATRWRIDLGAPIRATPTLAGGRLYVATDAALFALNPQQGAIIWSAPFGADRAPRRPMPHDDSAWDHYSSSAVVDGALIAVAARDGCVYALHTANGAQRWRTCTEDGVLTGTPAVTRDGVYFGGFDGVAYALSRTTGEVRWRRDLRGALPRDAVVTQGNVLFGSRAHELSALDLHTGEPAWVRYFWFSWVDSPPAAAGELIYVGASDGVSIQAFVGETGRRLWGAPVPGWSWAQPAIGRGAVYAAVAGGPYFAQREGGLASIDRRDGALRWFWPAPRPADPSATYGFGAAPVVGLGLVYAADLAGTVYAFPE